MRPQEMSPSLNSKFTLNGKQADESPATCDWASIHTTDTHTHSNGHVLSITYSTTQPKQWACKKCWMFFDALLCCGRCLTKNTNTHYMLKDILTISRNAFGEEGCSSVSFSPLEPCDCGRTSLSDRLSRVSQQALHESFSLRGKTMWLLWI